MTLRIVLVDDHRMVVDALADRLAAEPDLAVSTREPAGAEAMVAAVRPDVVVLEVAPLDEERRGLVTRLRAMLGDAALIVLSGDDDPQTAAEAAVLGADGWISKEAGVQEVIDLIREAARGRAWFPPRQLGAALTRLRQAAGGAEPTAGPLDVLTDREREILAALAAGQPAVSIASCLRVSANTVRTHVSSVYEKLEVHSRLAAVAAGRAAGLRPAPIPERGTVLALHGDAPPVAR